MVLYVAPKPTAHTQQHNVTPVPASVWNAPPIARVPNGVKAAAPRVTSAVDGWLDRISHSHSISEFPVRRTYHHPDMFSTFGKLPLQKYIV